MDECITHDHCLRKLIITADFQKGEIRCILRHEPMHGYEDKIRIHDVDNYIATRLGHYSRGAEINKTIRECLKIAESSALVGYDSIEIHLDENNSRHHFDHAKYALYRKGWHCIDAEGTKFIHYYDRIINTVPDTFTDHTNDCKQCKYLEV